MKKIEKVSIGGIQFTLDADAYVSLKQYLDSLHAHYAADPDGTEITRDIEARIAELILDRQVYTKVVGKELVDSIVAQLGSAEQIDDSSSEGLDGAASDGSGRIGRRLYRARSPRILGGVCGGLANYFNINVLWVRLIFLAPVILNIVFNDHRWLHSLFSDWSGIAILAYIALWIAVPTARTARQNLEARGERITADSIRQTLNSAAESPTAKRANSVAAEVLIVLGRIVLFFIKFVCACVAFGFLVAGLVVAAMLWVLIFMPESLFVGGDLWIPNLFVVEWPWIVGLALFCVAVPLLMGGVDLVRFVFGVRTGRVWRAVRVWVIVVWTVALFAGLSLAGSRADEIREAIRSGPEGRINYNNGGPGRSIIRFDDRQEQWRKEIRVVPDTLPLPQADSLSAE